MIQNILTHYRKQFPFDKFYDNLNYNISTWPEYHIVSETFLKGYDSQTKVTQYEGRIFTNNGDIRVDLPVWFGDPNSNFKIVIIGLEPRDTDKEGFLNIERVGQYVFATPFALERPKGQYYSAFHDLMNSKDLFVYFTDVVKTYQVSGDKKNDDEVARQTFLKKAQDEKKFLFEELEIINPSLIVALGNESFVFLKELLGDKYRIQKVRHPSQGGAKIAREQLSEMMQQRD